MARLPWTFKEQVTEGEVSQLGYMDSGNKLQKKTRALGDMLRVLVQDELLLPADPLG